MKKFALTIKKPDLAPPEWDEMSRKIINLLKSQYGLLDEPDECNTTIGDYIIHYTNAEQAKQDLKDIAVLIFGNDWFSTVKYVSDLRLVGDSYNKILSGDCPNCGHNEYHNSGEYMVCDQCDYHSLDDYQENDFNDDYTSLI